MEVIFGVQNHVGMGQECARAVLIFLYGLLMVRVSGPRTFAQWSALDIVISIIVGSTLSRALTGNASLPGTLAAVTVLFMLHFAFAYCSAASERLSALIEGRPLTLVKDGLLDEASRVRHAVSKVDIAEAMRERELKGLEDIGKVQALQLEPDGTLSVLKRVGPQKLAEHDLTG